MTRNLRTCLLRNLSTELCEPLNPLYIGLHGTSGTGGRVGAAGIPLDYTGILLGDSPAREGQSAIYTKLEKYVDSFHRQFPEVKERLRAEGATENEIRIKSMYLWSEEPGTGKTTTASALLNEYILRHYMGSLKRGVTPKQRPAYFLDGNDLQTDYNAFNRPKVPDDIANPASQRYYRALEKAKHTEFVVLDDIGTRVATEGFRDDLRSVINHRVSHQLPTIYTSNIPVSKLHTVYDQASFVDRIRDMTQEIHFEGKSKRGRRK